MYIDPGSGTLWWQLLLATCVGAIYHIRQNIFRLLGKLRKFPKIPRINEAQPNIEKQSD
jgi:hypothetical protein